VHVHAADVSKEDDVRALLADMPAPLKGVLHAAAILDDCIVVTLTAEKFFRPLEAKLFGAWYLHQHARDLDFFVAYSSAAALLGTVGQASYVAANAFLGALATWRARAGQPGTSIDWGAFDVGFAAPALKHAQRLAVRGVSPFTEAEGHALLDRALAPDAPASQALLRFDARRWLEAYPHAATPFFAELSTSATTASHGALRQQLASAPVAERRAAVARLVEDLLERVLGMPSERIDPDTPFRFYGLDSATSLELRNNLEASLSLKLSAALFFTYPTSAALVDRLVAEIS
jgi:acyl carrier protein